MGDTGRWLGLDYGEQRVGVALSDGLGLMAHPHPYIPNTPALWSNLAQLIAVHGVTGIVVGLPLALSGGDTIQTGVVRGFIHELNQRVGVPVLACDERFSTVAAGHQLAHIKGKKRRQMVDSQSAAFVLQGFLDAQSKQVKE